MVLGKVLKGLIEDGIRVVKVLLFGDEDVQEVVQAAPFGIDSNPIKDMVAVYSDTATKGEPIIVGYVNPVAIANVGEIRLFSADDKGEIKTYIHLKNSGEIEIGGTTNNLVRHKPLDEGMQQLVLKINAELAKISAGIAAAGGAYTPESVSVDISNSKCEKLKCE